MGHLHLAQSAPTHSPSKSAHICAAPPFCLQSLPAQRPSAPLMLPISSIINAPNRNVSPAQVHLLFSADCVEDTALPLRRYYRLPLSTIMVIIRYVVPLPP